MKKPFKVMTTASLSAVLAASAIVPVAASAAENNVASYIEDVIFSYDNTNFLTLSFEEYREAYSANVLVQEGLTYIHGDNKEIYSFEEYREAYSAFNNDAKKALAALTPVKLDNLKPGKVDVDTKKVVAADDQPEDRLNETFFYNFAA